MMHCLFVVFLLSVSYGVLLNFLHYLFGLVGVIRVVVIGVGVGSVEGVELVVVVFVVMGRLFRGVCVPFDMRWS